MSTMKADVGPMGKQYLLLLAFFFIAIRKGVRVKEIIEKLEQRTENKSQKPHVQRKPRERYRHDRDMDVAEVYSPPRVAKTAVRVGMKAGWSLDLTSLEEFNDKP